MPGEEMEITTDFGQAGFGEDIDIDLDFAVGQTDEDMELADFDQVQEIPNFNSDTRDELMAEGDDASYGMIDADDIENNEVAVASNDIEIDLGDPEESLWQQNAAPEENFEPVVEIDIVEATDVGNANVNTENVGTGQGSWLEASTYSINKPDEVDATQVDVGTIDATGDNLLPNSEVLIEDDVASQDLGLAVTEGDNAETLDVGENNNIEAESRIQNAYDEQQNVPADASLQESTKEPVVDEQHEQQEHEENDSRSDKHASEGNNIYETHKDVQHQASGDDVSEIGYDSDDNDDNSLQHGEQPSAPVASDHGSVAEHHVEQEQERVNQQDPTDLGDIEQQLGSNLHDEPANDHESSNQTYNLEAAVAGDQRKPLARAFVEHPLSVATRHEMYISYGNTDYRLFAKSEADDPNKYFLSDMAALEFPLGQLLSSLRDVISDELSPLDELVMHVDVLGLEFSESSTAEILEKFTFGDILGLYDRLVKNDGSEPPPDLYTYLMVRPNCRQRFIALRDSADSGRGLSEIAIFREDTPIDGEGAGEFDSHSPYALPSGEEEDEAYDYEESGAVEDEADQGEAGEVENNDEPNSPSVHGSAIGTNTEDPTGEAVEAAEADAADVASEADEADDADEAGENDDNNADASADATTADGLIDFSDDELDLSSTKQGNSQTSLFSPLVPISCTGTKTCICDDCFAVEIMGMEASWQLDSLKSVSSGSSVGADQPFKYELHRSNIDLPTISPTEQHFFIPQLRSFENLQIFTNIHQLQDQQANGSPHDRTDEIQNEHDAFTATERSYPNQHSSPINGTADAPSSNITSATATLNGDDKDEIDYSDDDGEEITGGNDVTSNSGISVSATLKVPINDEITWESEDEDAQDEPVTTSKATVQVSPVSGKRARSDSDLDEGVTERSDVKRRRPS
ncbi:hypothetical protein GL218_04915 [Daldinia childiae]|uniref:uncharacterized protein n=1 Tax=Daldinia childiae TaxID=326645 RepID=UPI001445D8C5|nr:uncharacterized protein GL218_04915 [Daldinia childiae]KAF3059402.1 hypothetical protein GL218_04915 [Daldinia childiae]